MRDRSTCLYCGAPLVWAKGRATGAMLCLDAEPCADGEFVVGDDDLATVLYGDLFDAVTDANGLRYRSHFASCPDAKIYRRRK